MEVSKEKRHNKIMKPFWIKITRFLSQRTPFSEQFITFLFVGALNTLVGYLLYSFFVWLGFNYIWAPLFATILGVLFNFKTIGGIVFKTKNNRLIGKFFAVYAIVYICNVAGLKTLSYCHISNPYMAGAILVLPLAFLGFFLNKKWVFCPKEGK